jgi:hypothetical protein
MLVFPEPVEQSTCVLLLIPSELVPIVGSLFGQLESRRKWASDADWQLGYKAFVELQDQLMNNCLTDLVQEIRDLRGVKPDYVGVEPALRTSDMYRSLNDLIQSMQDMRGILNDGWFTDQYATIADVVQALRGNNQDTASEMWSQLAALLGAGASLASIVSFIGDFLTAQEETVVEGGLMIALITLVGTLAAMLQQIATTQGIQGVQIDAIITALRGATPPEDNIIELLR